MASLTLDSPMVVAILVIALLSYKNLPGIWHFRFFRAVLTRLYISPTTIDELSPECLFLSAIHRTRAPLSECDYNIHKSNSTYFMDIDISRGNLCLVLFSQRLSFRPKHNTASMALGGVQCIFKREIKPYQPYEVWSRILSWDEKWIYIVTHFVVRGAHRPARFRVQGQLNSEATARGKKRNQSDKEKGKTVFASAVSRFVFKQGRKTIAPERMLVECGLLPPATAELDCEISANDTNDCSQSERRLIEDRRKRDLDIAQLKLGWDAVYDTFEGDVSTALGRYTDLFWR
ncbi:uncharacterized protein N7477_006395 [Penicillium maclennaniae]|uniref:uncharacterized protein n=1 Tax=Penicillium maclennaniae TaxID=1343394 RepID=UPI002541ACC7|nr:uncharacterized protein N7477_006395 [Penicillium maclennaniae]KAJ5667825.1 hypothetical protein N7477_006395 [Penicillium maclennaniae]